jgi:hypothetical protein
MAATPVHSTNPRSEPVHTSGSVSDHGQNMIRKKLTTTKACAQVAMRGVNCFRVFNRHDFRSC